MRLLGRFDAQLPVMFRPVGLLSLHTVTLHRVGNWPGKMKDI